MYKERANCFVVDMRKCKAGVWHGWMLMHASWHRLISCAAMGKLHALIYSNEHRIDSKSWTAVCDQMHLNPGEF